MSKQATLTGSISYMYTIMLQFISVHFSVHFTTFNIHIDQELEQKDSSMFHILSA